MITTPKSKLQASRQLYGVYNYLERILSQILGEVTPVLEGIIKEWGSKNPTSKFESIGTKELYSPEIANIVGKIIADNQRSLALTVEGSPSLTLWETRLLVEQLVFSVCLLLQLNLIFEKFGIQSKTLGGPDHEIFVFKLKSLLARATLRMEEVVVPNLSLTEDEKIDAYVFTNFYFTVVPIESQPNHFEIVVSLEPDAKQKPEDGYWVEWVQKVDQKVRELS